MFRGATVRSRGIVLVALDQNATMLGTVTLVGSESAARRLAIADEAELHLLCVRPDMRRNGIGRALVQAALVRARTRGVTAIVLWTQPTMLAAQRLYQECGFHREPSADFRRGERSFSYSDTSSRGTCPNVSRKIALTEYLAQRLVDTGANGQRTAFRTASTNPPASALHSPCDAT